MLKQIFTLRKHCQQRHSNIKKKLDDMFLKIIIFSNFSIIWVCYPVICWNELFLFLNKPSISISQIMEPSIKSNGRSLPKKKLQNILFSVDEIRAEKRTFDETGRRILSYCPFLPFKNETLTGNINCLILYMYFVY